jgi:hypothetical protein
MRDADAVLRGLVTIPGYMHRGHLMPKRPMPGGVLGGCLALLADIDRLDEVDGAHRRPLLGGLAREVAAIIMAEVDAEDKERWLSCRRGRSGI